MEVLEYIFIGTAILVIISLYTGNGLLITIAMCVNIVIFAIAITYCCIVWGKEYIETLNIKKEQKNGNM